ncbi:MAG: SDR family oxidoreductase [Phycisphaerae bacterium]|nr:SDR family oxidoreductase [Phycisphaerae bacterium]
MSGPTRASDRVAVVTGAGSGIGRAVCVRLASAGWSLSLIGRRSEPIEETSRLCREAGAPRTMTLAAHVGRPADDARIVASARRDLGGFHVLVNNAGWAPVASIDHHTPGVLDEVFAVNALGPARLIALAWPVFAAQRRGCIVNVSSLATIDPFPGFFGYAAAKASLNLMARSCAKEGASLGIRAFAVAPGAVETPMLRANFTEQQVPASRCLTPDMVARVIVECIDGGRDGENGGTVVLRA